MTTLHKNIIILTIIFACSVIIRIPQLGNIEWSTAHILMTLRNMYSYGAHTYYFSPVFNIENPTDKWLDIFPSGIHDQNGNLYYISFPPLGFLIPYAILRILNIYPDILPVQIISLGIHFLTALGIYFLTNYLYNKKIKTDIYLPSIAAFTVYLFTPQTLWFHSNYFMAHLFIHPIWIIQAYLYLKIVKEQKFNSNKHIALFSLIAFLSVYTDWLGFFTTFVFAGLFFLKHKSKKIALISLSSAFAALIAIIIQYSFITGPITYLTNIKDKLLIRSGLSVNKDSFEHWQFTQPEAYLKIIQSYIKGYLFLLVSLVTMLGIWINKNKKVRKLFTSEEKQIVIALLTPVILHHLILFNFTSAHDSSVLITASFLAIFFAILLHKLIPLIKTNFLYQGLFLLLVFSLLASSYVLYDYESKYKIKLYDVYISFGKEIQNIAQPDEIIFYCNATLINKGIPPLSFEANRTVVPCQNTQEAQNLIEKIRQKTNKPQKAVVIYYTQEYKVEKIERISTL